MERDRSEAEEHETEDNQENEGQTQVMNNDKMINFLKRWRTIETAQKDLDFRRSELMRDIRAEYERGKIGDEQFCNWCVTELGVTAFQATELLQRANAASTVPDAKTWNAIGGFKALRPLQDLPRREQINVLEAVKASAKAVRTIMRERKLGSYADVVEPVAHKPVTKVALTGNALVQHNSDAEILTAYIARSCKNIPRDILKIMARYTATTALKAVA